MYTRLLLFILVFFLTIQTNSVFAQDYTLKATITNQPDNPVILEWISGDDFTKIDSAKAVNSEVNFHFSENAHAGVYRLVLGQTGYARVMNENPQMLNFIFNEENVSLKINFDNPAASVIVLHSKENEVYFDFLKRLAEYQNALSLMEQELDGYWEEGDTAKASQTSNEFNNLQMEWDLRVVQTVQQNASLYASKLIAMKRVPLKDGFLSIQERKEQFKSEFLNTVDFNDESLIYSSALSDKIFEYLVLFNQHGYTEKQRTEAYIQAVDKIFSHLGTNSKINDFVVAYLVHGFEVLKMNAVIDHIRKNY